MVFGGNFNLFFQAELEAQGGNQNYISKTNRNKMKIDLCDIWREKPKHEALLFVNNILLVIFKEDSIIFSYLMFYKNLLKT